MSRAQSRFGLQMSRTKISKGALRAKALIEQVRAKSTTDFNDCFRGVKYDFSPCFGCIFIVLSLCFGCTFSVLSLCCDCRFTPLSLCCRVHDGCRFIVLSLCSGALQIDCALSVMWLNNHCTLSVRWPQIHFALIAIVF